MKVAIVTPSFNQAEFIERTIESVISQDWHSLEYIVIDGGSKDGTVNILKQYEHKLNWISEPDHGQSHAVNKGIKRTNSDIIGWLNSDDIYYPKTIKKVCQFFADHPEVDVVYGQANYIDRAGNLLYPYPTERWNVERIKSVCFISQPATFFRRKVVEKYGFIDEHLHFCMDYEYWLRLAEKGVKFAYLKELLAGARVYPETKTSSGCIKASLEAMDMLQKKLERIPPEWVLNYASAIVKTKLNLHYPQLRFIIAVWLHLWQAAGLKYQGLDRLRIWFSAQYAMLARFFRKLIR